MDFTKNVIRKSLNLKKEEQKQFILELEKVSGEELKEKYNTPTSNATENNNGRNNPVNKNSVPTNNPNHTTQPSSASENLIQP
jgi:hypothetical protein